MILATFPREISFGSEEGATVTLLPFHAEARDDGNVVLDPHRVYLALEETVHSLDGMAVRHGLPLPARLPAEILERLPRRPRSVAELLADPPRRRVRVCLINGGGGGLGDGILSAPAFMVLGQRLLAATGTVPQLDACSMLPRRTGAVLAGIPGLRVRTLPLTLAEYMEYDAVADLSGMLDDPAFQRSHMTDFVLTRLGLDPAGVADADKEPFLALPQTVPTLVAEHLARAYAAAAGRPLVAVIFISSYTRSLPEPKAAALIRRLAGAGCQPVLMSPEGHSAPDFMARYDLQGAAVDVSAASRTFLDYFLLLAGMEAIVTVDTSAVHVGAALKRPTVALFNSIDREYRIRYSPTVQGIQMSYQGRTCQAPCGLSKSRAYVEGRLPDGSLFRLECGYACDEAVDREAILHAAGEAISGIGPADDVAVRCEEIRHQMADRFHAHSAPCWAALDEGKVVAALSAMLQATAAEAAIPDEVIHVGAE